MCIKQAVLAGILLCESSGSANSIEKTAKHVHVLNASQGKQALSAKRKKSARGPGLEGVGLMTHKEIAKEMKVTVARVGQIEREALVKLEAALERRLNGLDWWELFSP